MYQKYDCWVDKDYISLVEIFVVFILMWCKIIKSTSDCLCFKLGSLYFIKTSIIFSLLKKVEKKSPQVFSFLVENIKITAIFHNFLISSKAVENSQFSSIFILKQEWQSCYSQCFTAWKGFFNNFHKSQLHCTQYYFFKYCFSKFETVSSRLLPLHICSTKK